MEEVYKSSLLDNHVLHTSSCNSGSQSWQEVSSATQYSEADTHRANEIFNSLFSNVFKGFQIFGIVPSLQ